MSQILKNEPFSIDVILAELSLTVEQLVALEVGMLFPLAKSAAEVNLRLSINGEVLAEGTLVRGEDDIFFEIQEINQSTQHN